MGFSRIMTNDGQRAGQLGRCEGGPDVDTVVNRVVKRPRVVRNDTMRRELKVCRPAS